MKRKEWDPWTWDRGVCIKVLLKFDLPDFLEHSRPAEELFPPREQLPLADTSSEADALQVMLALIRIHFFYFSLPPH